MLFYGAEFSVSTVSYSHGVAAPLCCSLDLLRGLTGENGFGGVAVQELMLYFGSKV